MAKYKARPGTAFKDDEAEVIGHFLEEHFSVAHEATPEDVVELAKPRNSPIHEFFDWDDTSAARKYRLQQARRLIQCLVVVIDGKDAPAYVNVRIQDDDSDGRAYVSTDRARGDKALWAQVLEEAKSGLLAWKRRYEVFAQIEELEPVIKEIKKLENGAPRGKRRRKRRT